MTWVWTVGIAAAFVVGGLAFIAFARVAAQRWLEFREWERLRDQSVAEAQAEARVRAQARLRHPNNRRRNEP